MKDDVRDRRWLFGWALPASLVVHSLIAALLIFGLPPSLSQPQEEEAIKVDLVPPPEPQKKTKAEPPPALKPIFQFGEKDAGPRESVDGNSAEEGSASPTETPDPDKQDVAGPPALTAAGETNQDQQPAAPETTTSKTEDPARAQQAVKLQRAKRLFSPTMIDSLTATTAIGNMPRGVRVGALCSTELHEQLANASPPYSVQRVPFDRLKEGTVIEIFNTAFQAGGRWYSVSYRCGVNARATRVTSFAFRVGNLVPRSEWKRRGLPME